MDNRFFQVRQHINEAPREGRVAAADEKKTVTLMLSAAHSRRHVAAGTAAVGATILTGARSAAAEQDPMKKTFTILHTNDMHSAFIGMAPASDYSPLKLNDDKAGAGMRAWPG